MRALARGRRNAKWSHTQCSNNTQRRSSLGAVSSLLQSEAAELMPNAHGHRRNVLSYVAHHRNYSPEVPWERPHHNRKANTYAQSPCSPLQPWTKITSSAPTKPDHNSHFS